MTLLDVVPIPVGAGGAMAAVLGSTILVWCFITILTAIVAVIAAIVIKISRARKRSKLS